MRSKLNLDCKSSAPDDAGFVPGMQKKPAESAPEKFWESPLEPVYHNIRKNLEGHPHANFIEIYIGLSVIVFLLLFASLAPYIGEKLGLISQRKDQQQAFAQETCPSIPQEEFGKKPDLERAKQVAGLLDESTKDLLGKYEDFKKSPEEAKKKLLIESSKIRKNHLVEAIRKNPDDALSSILSVQEDKDLRELVSNCMEKEATFEGSLEILHADFFEDKVSDTQYTLTTADNQKINLHPAGELYVALESQTKVKVKGMLIDDDLVFDGTKSVSQAEDLRGGIDVISQPGNPPVTGEQKTVVILANFQNTTQPSLTKDQEKDFIATQVAPYYAENSYNKISITGDVFGWYTIPIDQTCSYGTVRSEAIKAADNDIYFPNYSRLVIVATYGPSCGWGGLGTIGKQNVSTLDGAVVMSTAWIMSYNARSLHLVGHELGHNFGNHHATFLDCGDQVITVGKTGCSIYEYSDRWDIMGSGNFHFNAPHKEYVGWFDSSNIQTVTVSGRSSIEPIETATTGLKALKIQRGLADYLYVEYRQSIGYDTSSLSWDIFDGALLHVLLSSNRTAVLDLTPLDYTNHITLQPGASFIDPETKTKITVVSATATALTVDVLLGKTDFTPPTVSITSPAIGSTVSGTINVAASASDTAGIEKVEFYYRYSGILDKYFATDTTAPYEASLDTTKTPNGQGAIGLRAKAYDLSGTPFGVSNNVGLSASRVLSVANTDSTSPNVTLVSPTDGSTVTSPVFFGATAADNVGIWKIEFLKDNALSAVDYESPYSSSIVFSAGPHTATAKAYDFVGNTTSTPVVNFTVSTSIPTPSPSPTPTPTPSPVPSPTPSPPSDLVQPTVSITDPLNGSTVSRNNTVTISANASDNVGVAKVEFRVNGNLQCTDTTVPYTCAWKVSGKPNAPYTIEAKAYDAAGNYATVNVNVKSSS